jgi:nitroreductase
MMDVLEAIETRREITAFRPDPIPGGVMERLKRALYLAPAGNNLPSREFIVVTDRATLDGLAETTPYMAWLRQAAAGVAIVANPKVSKYWLQDASIAGAFLWLAATADGLGAAWGAVYHSEDAGESARRETHVRNLLGVPDEYRVVAVIGLGYPAARPPAKDMHPPERVLHRESFGRA